MGLIGVRLKQVLPGLILRSERIDLGHPILILVLLRLNQGSERIDLRSARMK